MSEGNFVIEEVTRYSGIEAQRYNEKGDAAVAGIRKRCGDRKLLITGTARCGSTYCAHRFRMPHEYVFNHDTRFSTKLGEDVSMFAVPFLWLLDRDEWYIVHLVRHPQMVVGSHAILWDFHRTNSYYAWYWGKGKELDITPLEWYKTCIAKIDMFGADEELRVEDLGESKMNTSGMTYPFQSDELLPYLERWDYLLLDKWGDVVEKD